jgi:DNA-binding transcriptional LysR family regulator
LGEAQAPYQLLSAFVAVAEQASFTKAARKLGVGKGTVSRAVAELERQLGMELLHRTTHTVALSTAGVALYERTAPHLAALDVAVLKLPESATEPSGELRLTTPPDFGVAVLPELLLQFARRYPKISLDVWLTNTNIDLVKEGFDLAIRAGPALKDSTLTARRLGGGRVGFFASPEYLARRGKPKEPNDADHDWLLHRALRRSVKPFQSGTPRILCDDMLLIRELARKGAGIGLLPLAFAAPYVQDGSLEEVPVSLPGGISGGLFLVYPSSGEVPRKVTAFRDFLLDWLKKSSLA